MAASAWALRRLSTSASKRLRKTRQVDAPRSVARQEKGLLLARSAHRT
jgi:hypothetical protein